MAEDDRIMPDESEVAGLSGHGGGRSLIAMAHNARLMGSYAGEQDKTAKLPGSHAFADGCQWARTCNKCPWNDCVVGNDRCDYDSGRAKEIRGSMETNTKRSRQAVRKRPAVNINMRRMQIVGAKRSGISENDVAVMFGVHIRTVRRAVEWVEGLHDKPWGRHR